jgi:hypothetical protein
MEAVKVQNVLMKYSSKPFDWNGASDCCVFCGEMLDALGFIDPMSKFEYGNKADALKAISKHGTLVDAITSVMGEAKEITREELETGDILISKQTDGSWIPGVYMFERIAVRTKKGVTDWPIEYASWMWRPEPCLKQ